MLRRNGESPTKGIGDLLKLRGGAVVDICRLPIRVTTCFVKIADFLSLAFIQAPSLKTSGKIKIIL